MSCIAGALALDGSAVDTTIVAQMLAFMRRRAPDGGGVKSLQPAALGHALLRTGVEEPLAQPLTIDGQVWIAAAARIDGRSELAARLRAAGEEVPTGASDAEYLLHAYRAWGPSMTSRLVGDFAFAIWDGPRRRLLCARDHLGVRPFYYARVGDLLLFASDPRALLQHPGADRTMDEVAVFDFLCFGMHQTADHTFYRGVRALPPASCLLVEDGRMDLQTFWRLPADKVLRYADTRDYLEHFRSLFEQAVADRLPTGRVAIELSGGMDSSSIAAVAADRLKPGTAIKTLTRCMNRLLPEDHEAEWAQQIAEFLGLRWQRISQPETVLFGHAGIPAFGTVEPLGSPFLGLDHQQYNGIVQDGTAVVLSGHGGDAVFDHSNHYLLHLLRTGQLATLWTEARRHRKETGSWRGMGFYAALARGRGHEHWRPPYPSWLAPEFERRVDAPDRWNEVWRSMQGGSGIHHQLTRVWLGRLFALHECFELPLEYRYPFYDLRLVEFCLSLPNVTKRDKLLLRQLMVGRLPEEVLKRPKTPLQGNAIGRALHLAGTRGAERLVSLANPVPWIVAGKYEVALKAATVDPGEDVWASMMLATPAGLGIWMENEQCWRDTT